MLNFCLKCIKMGIPSLKSAFLYCVGLFIRVFHEEYLHEVIKVSVKDALGI